MDKAIIRITAIAVNLYIPIALYFAWNGIDIKNYDHIFSSSIMLGLVLVVLSHSQGRYHCKWMRGLCYNSLAVPSVGFIDSQYIIFEDAMTYIYVISFMWASAVIYTICMAVYHFRKVKTLNKKRNGIHQVNLGGESEA